MTIATDPTHQSEFDNLSKHAFRVHVTKLRKQYGLPAEVKIKRKSFESLEDLEAFMAHYDSAEVHSGRPTAITSSKTSTTSAKSRKAKSAISAALAKKKAAALAKKKAARAAQSSRRPIPSVPKTKPARGRAPKTAASRPISSLMTPGLYNGSGDSDPWRVVGRKYFPREIDPSKAKFRRQKRGVGKCTGTKLKQVTSAFGNSYYFAESARQEVSAIRRSRDAMLLWHASYEHEEASLAYWFGADYSPRQINSMLAKIESILTEWSLAHCAGFRGLLPVWIRCKSKNGVGTGPARHITANTIELFPRYFDMSQSRRWVTMLHEMGHRSTRLLTPRDERNDLCVGGWNRANNMCYRDHGDVDVLSTDRRFIGGNPRELAIAAADGNSNARKTALNNIDNYVCYMWNRHQDHRTQMIYLLPPGAKEIKGPRATTPASSGS